MKVIDLMYLTEENREKIPYTPLCDPAGNFNLKIVADNQNISKILFYKKNNIIRFFSLIRKNDSGRLIYNLIIKSLESLKAKSENCIQMKLNESIHSIILFVIITVLVSCKYDANKSHEVSVTTIDRIVIDIQPFDDFPESYTDYVFKELKKTYSNIEIKPKISLPKSAYYAIHNRYRADSLIKFLSKKTTDNHVVIGLTTKDISTTKGKIHDWGVMGLSYCPGNSCIVSTFRLRKTNILIQLFKVSIHELGHSQGLPHCPVKSCFMRDAEGKNHTDEETEFCQTCKNYLMKKGWVF